MTQRHSSTNLLYPPFRDEILKGIAKANQAGVPLAVFESYRSSERQDALYAQGRTTPGKIVTNAKGGDSWHQYGLAIDVALFDDGEWSWNFDPKRVSQFFESPLLKWGGTFKRPDGPHYEWSKKMSLSEAKAHSQAAGILYLWTKLT